MTACGYNFFLEDSVEHSDVLQHLEANLHLPQGTAQMNSKFTITNKSSQLIHLKELTCHVNDITLKDGFFYRVNSAHFLQWRATCGWNHTVKVPTALAVRSKFNNAV